MKRTVTIEFTGGLLKGLTYVKTLDASIAYVGYACSKPVAGSPYRVVAVYP